MTQENTNLVPTAGGAVSEYTVLNPDGAEEMREILKENFGEQKLSLADIDKIKLPGGGGLAWEVQSGDGPKAEPFIEGIVLGFADTKVYWKVSFDDVDTRQQPDCKSSDTVYGVGDPFYLNEKEVGLVNDNQINKQARSIEIPGTGGQLGYACSSCPHNQFGSAAKGGGKACQDKRLLIFLFPGEILPVLIRLPATSIPPMKDYMRTLVQTRTGGVQRVVTRLGLKKIEGVRPYSVIVPTMVRKMTPEEITAAHEYKQPFTTALTAPDAIERSLVEKGGGSMDDMPGMTGTPPAGTSNVNVAADSKDQVTTKQIGLMRGLAREKNLVLEDECTENFGCLPADLSKKAASAFIEYLQEADASDADTISSEKPETDSDDDSVPF